MRYAFFVFGTVRPMQNDLLPQELTVGELTALIKQTLEGSFYGLKVTGEISNFRPASSGHWFFALKDNDAVINAVMFKSVLWRVGFTPKNGDKVTVTGSIDVYPPRGTYQIVCSAMEMTGNGEILAMLEARKRQFDALGYFDPDHKAPLPLYPQRVGVVTSPTGAALQDILQILGRRAPSLDVVILPAVVQGDGAAATIAQRIEEANLLHLCDVLIVARGGGSIEDLLPFSEECVVKAIFDSEIPVVSGVGHEIDWALCDYAADVRASTPSAAAELVSKGYNDLRQSLSAMEDALIGAIQRNLDQAAMALRFYRAEELDQRMTTIITAWQYQLANASDGMEGAMRLSLSQRQSVLGKAAGALKTVNPKVRLTGKREVISSARTLLEAAMRTRLAGLQETIRFEKDRLEALNPLAILARGFSVTTDERGNIITHAATLAAGQHIGIRFQDGKRKAVVEE